jgi:hypothetical protein
MKLLLIGHAEHGKDTVAEMLAEMHGITYRSSSEMANEIFIFEALKGKYGYQTKEECFKDRKSKRKEWHDLICEYNANDKARLAKDILAHADMYIGMRSNVEIQECQRQGLFDLILGVFDPRKPLEPKESFDIDFWVMPDIIIPNSSSLEDLWSRLCKLSIQ